MKQVTRAQLRGKPLDEVCREKAFVERKSWRDERCFCSGVKGMGARFRKLKCGSCRAYIDNEEDNSNADD